MTQTWTTSSSIPQMTQFLRTRSKVVVLTHAKPDGDAVGSSTAVVRALNLAAGREVATAWHAGPMPPWYGPMMGDTPGLVLPREGPPADAEADAIVVVDTGSWPQLEHVRSWLSWQREQTLVLDHHVHGDADVGDQRIIDTSAASAAQVVAPLCVSLLGVKDVASLPQPIADALYLGVASDTGWFRHSNVSPAVFDFAAALLRAGARHVPLHQLTEQQEGESRLRLMARALESLRLLEGGTLAVMSLTLEDFAQTNAQPGESGGFVDLAMQIAKVRVSAVLTEVESREGGRLTKISLRSKEGDNAVDVNRLTRALGGGGHVRAAGARVAMTLAQTRDEIARLVREQEPK